MDALTNAEKREDAALGDDTTMLRRFRMLALAGAVFAGIGGVLPVALSPLFSTQFRSETQLTVRGASENTILAAIKATQSRQSADNIIRALDLGQTEGFAVNSPTIIRIASEVFSGKETTVAEAEEALRRRLLDALSITYETVGQRLVIVATAAEAKQAAAIAERTAEEFRHAILSVAGTSVSPQVEALRKTAGRADAALSGFTGKFDAAALAKLQQLQQEGNALDAEITALGGQLADLQQKEKTAAAMTVADVLTKPLPDSLEFTGLEYQRQRFVQAEVELEQLSVQLGPKHPKHMAAQAVVDDAKRDIKEALQQLAASLSGQAASAAKSLEGLKADKADVSSDPQMTEAAAQLAVLEGAAEEARQNLARAEGNTSAATPVSLPRMAVIAPASAVSAKRLGPDLTTLIVGGAAAGGLVGMAIVDLWRRRQEQLAEDVAQDTYELDGNFDVGDGLVEPVAEPQPVVAEEDQAVDLPWILEDELPIHGELEEEPLHEEAANDVTFGDRIRALLEENRLRADEADLPPLVATAVEQSEERHAEEIEERAYWLGDLADGNFANEEEELAALLRKLNELRALAALQEARQRKAKG
jgi:polysaccharide biosynthesis transport protein